MKTQSLLYASVLALAQLGQCSPTPTRELERRDLISDAIHNLEDGLSAAANEGFDVVGKILTNLDNIVPTARPASVQDAMNGCQEILAPTGQPKPNLVAAIGQLVAGGLTSDSKSSLGGSLDKDENSFVNNNARSPWPPAYPRAGLHDAPYSISESALRAAIHIPSSFRYGARGAPQPIIMVPGTGSTGYLTFQGNYIPLLQGSNIADPVWLNIPEYALNDIQLNAEYVAYAINYIWGMCNHRKVAVLTWSQGSLMGQWAYKYWPSTRSRVTDQISISPDYHGTVAANLISPPGIAYPPSILQQQYNSQFVATLRSGGGDQAYVPTTNVYSGFFDEIVEPQQGDGASGFLSSSRTAEASNTEVQKACPFALAGGFYDHETTLANPVGYALLVDALKHDGPGKLERINLDSVCNNLLSPGLGLGDFLATQNNLLVAGVQTFLYHPLVLVEPEIKGYARGGPSGYGYRA
ncbi:unnamed protein product [Zymoseptoria tritici ST99CH_3D1]|nr:unnamed protein product [Zymoseptoria tritici ST99CH_3D1]